MFVTRASRHDVADIQELIAAHDWTDDHLADGVKFIARDGKVAGYIRLVEVEPGTVVISHLLVRADVRRSGVATRLMQAAMNSRGGKLYVCCHEHLIGFYKAFDFAVVPVEKLPESALDYFEKIGDYPTEPAHVHYFLTAR